MNTDFTQINEGLQNQRTHWREYFYVTKPVTSAMLVVPAVAALFIASGEANPLTIDLIAVLVGGFLAAAGANALNNYYDQASDALMYQTRNRPLPAGRMNPQQALNTGVVLTLTAFFVLAVGANLLSALLALGGMAVYVFGYTRKFKQRTTLNTVFSGASWAMPLLVGWAAGQGGLSVSVLILFGIMLYWAGPYYWSQGVIYRRDYARAGVPLLPIVHGDRPARAQILIYSILMFLMSLAPLGVGMLYTFYGVSALSLGGLFLVIAIYMYGNPGVKPAIAMYRYSRIYILVLFAAMILDRIAF